MLDLAVSERLRTEFFAQAHNTRLDLQIEVAKYPFAIPGLSDGGAHTKYLTGGIYLDRVHHQVRAREQRDEPGRRALEAERAAGLLRRGSPIAACCARATPPISWFTITTT